MTDAPDRIWLTNFVKDQYGARLGSGTVSDLDHGDNPDYPEYVRADLFEEMISEIDELNAEILRTGARVWRTVSNFAGDGRSVEDLVKVARQCAEALESADPQRKKEGEG